MSGLFEELKRRNVFKVGAAYVVLSWLLAQASDLAAETFAAPDWVMKMLVTLLTLALPLVLFFAWAFEMTPEGIKKEKDVDRSQSITHQTGRKLDFTIIAILVLALGYFAYDKFAINSNQAPANTAVIPANTANTAVIPAKAGIHTESNETATAEPRNPSPEPASKPSEKSIAVLPFVNMSSDPEQEYFSDGISEEILNALAKVEDLKVAGRTSSFAFKGQNQDLKNIGQALRVAHILEGSVRKSGNKLRITAQLIKVDDGYHMWSETYDRELTDIFAIQDEISQAILKQLKAQLMGEELPVFARADARAYDLYLLATQRMYERNLLSLKLAADLLDQAITIDPSYAPSYAQRGITALLLSDEAYGTIPREQSMAQGKTLLDHALALDPDLAEGLAGLGLYYNQQPGGYKNSIPVLRRAVALNPGLINASNWLQSALETEGNLLERNRILEQMVAHDPLYAPGFNNSIRSYTESGQQDKAWALIARVRPYMPGHPFIDEAEAFVHFSLGQFSQGLPLAEKASTQLSTDEVSRFTMGLGLLATNQYEQLEKVGTDGLRVMALTHLQRTEEASILALELTSQSQINPLFAHLVMTGRFEDLVRFVEARWPDLDAFEADFPGRNGYGSDQIGNIAWSYARTGNEEKFQDALARMKASLAHQKAQGADNYWLSMSEAFYAMLTGDEMMTLALLKQAIDKGYLADARLSNSWPVFKPLEGNVQYEAIQARMVENLNTERKKLGLEPLTT